MSTFLTDCRHAIRLYIRTPGATVIAISVLALGMAFVGAFLSLYVDLILRPHPGFAQSGQLATIGRNTGTDLIPISYRVVENLADEVTAIEAAAMSRGAVTLVGADREETATAMVSTDFFSGLRPHIAAGSGLRTEDHAPDAEPVVVLSHRYWIQRFEGDRDVVGTFLEIARDPRTTYLGPPGSFLSQKRVDPPQESAQFRIVGVMGESLPHLPRPAGSSFEPDIWLPLERAWPLIVGVSEALPQMSAHAYVRRARGVPASAVASELRARYEGPNSPVTSIPGTRLDAIDGLVFNMAIQRDAKRQLELFLLGSVLLALTAGTNVSLFLLARAPGRRRELGIRMAIGAPLTRLRRQLATEAGVLVIVSAALGLLCSVWISLYIRGLSFFREAEWHDVTLLDWRVVSLAVAFLVVLVFLVSLAPISGLKRLGIAESSGQISGRASLCQRLAGSAQIAVAGTFCGAAIAFGWYLSLLLLGDFGYETTDRFMVQTGAQNFSLTGDARTIEAARWREAVAAIPGVSAIAYGAPIPGAEPNNFPTPIPHPLDSTAELEIHVGEIEQVFVDLLGLNLLYGRAPAGQEADVLVVNQTFARAVWGRDDVVGETFSIGIRPGNVLSGRAWEIIGVLEDLSFGHPSAPVRPYVFRGYANFLVGTVIEMDLTAAALQLALEEIDSALDIEVRRVRPLEDMRRELIAPDRARSFLTIATAGLVLFIAALGIYSTQHYLVAAGRREYAIRGSLGGGPRALGRLVLGRGLILGLPGIALGTLLAFIVVAWLRDEYLSHDISTVAATIGVGIGLVSLLIAASLGPARQARSMQPALLLREE